MTKTNQVIKIKEHLRKNGSITSLQAINLFGCTRLSAKIFMLRERGWEIDTNMIESTDRYGNPCNFAKYTLIHEGE